MDPKSRLPIKKSKETKWLVHLNISSVACMNLNASRVIGTKDFGRIILTAQQMEIVNCGERRITIRGTPGSGKTLMIMIMALAAAGINKAGRVLVFVNEALIPKYERYFFEASERNLTVRDPIILPTDRMKEAQNIDDVFFDETPIEALVIR